MLMVKICIYVERYALQVPAYFVVYIFFNLLSKGSLLTTINIKKECTKIVRFVVGEKSGGKVPFPSRHSRP